MTEHTAYMADTAEDTETTYVGYYAVEGSTDLPVWVSACSYAHAEFLLGKWRAVKGQANATADRILSRDPVRIESDAHALRKLDDARRDAAKWNREHML